MLEKLRKRRRLEDDIQHPDFDSQVDPVFSPEDGSYCHLFSQNSSSTNRDATPQQERCNGAKSGDIKFDMGCDSPRPHDAYRDGFFVTPGCAISSKSYVIDITPGSRNHIIDNNKFKSNENHDDFNTPQTNNSTSTTTKASFSTWKLSPDKSVYDSLQEYVEQIGLSPPPQQMPSNNQQEGCYREECEPNDYELHAKHR